MSIHSLNEKTDEVTVERTILVPGVIGHIARHRTWNVSTYKPVATDRWFHYDQVGSVMAETNASGNMTAQYHPDAFGNQMASWETGLWTNTYNDRKGWHHNTKEFDSDTGLVYMYQRWYFPEAGTFVNKAP